MEASLHSRFDGKVAIVTGGAAGIGAACVKRLKDEGAVVVSFDAKEENHLADVSIKGDVRDELSVKECVSSAFVRFGSIHILINAAGVGGGGHAHALDTGEWDRVVDINLKGTFIFSKHCLARMFEAKHGAIVNVASVNGIVPLTGQTPYSASKAAVIMLTKQLALDYSASGIRVNCVCPGLIETPGMAHLNGPDLSWLRDQIVSLHANKRIGRPEEVAACVAFLASDEASFVSGHSLICDGGWTSGQHVGNGLQ